MLTTKDRDGITTLMAKETSTKVPAVRVTTERTATTTGQTSTTEKGEVLTEKGEVLTGTGRGGASEAEVGEAGGGEEANMAVLGVTTKTNRVTIKVTKVSTLNQAVTTICTPNHHLLIEFREK